MEYKVIVASNHEELSTQLTLLLKVGWELHGKAFYTENYCHQALIKVTL